MTERKTQDRIAALEQARVQIEIALGGNEAWLAFRRTAAEPGRPPADAALAGDPLYRSWQLLNEAIRDLCAKATRQREPGTPPDDLTRIRGVGRDLARRLAERGITSFAQIAAWGPDDVRDVAEALGLGRQISRQNWIEQAALLDLRRPTRHAEPAPPAVAASVPAEPAADIDLDHVLAHLRNDPALRGDPPSTSPGAAKLPDQERPDRAVEQRGQRGDHDALPARPEEATVTFVIRESDHAAFVDYASEGGNMRSASPRFGHASATEPEESSWSAPPGMEAEEAEVVIVSRTTDRTRRPVRRSVRTGGN